MAARNQAWLAAHPGGTALAKGSLPAVAASCPRNAGPDGFRLAGPYSQLPPGYGVAPASQAAVVRDGQTYWLTSGSVHANNSKGVVVVIHPVSDPCAHPGTSATVTFRVAPGTPGTLRIVGYDASNGSVTLRSESGVTEHFMVATGTYGQ